MTMTIDSSVTLDVRADVRAGREPFARIMETIARLKCGEQLRLVAPIRAGAVVSSPPRAAGFLARSARHGFGRLGGAVLAQLQGPRQLPEKTPAVSPSPGGGARVVMEVDARGLEPPQPLVVILEALGAFCPRR